MKRLTFLLLFFLVSAVGVFAQDMSKPPAPVQNEVFDAMVGIWVGESEMMGLGMSETITISWDMNHQFLNMRLVGVGKDDPAMVYNGLGIYGVNAAGESKTWWFDDWGVDRTMEGVGSFDGMSYRMVGENESYTDDRTITWNDKGQMVMKWSGKVHVPGFNMDMNGETIYTKK